MITAQKSEISQVFRDFAQKRHNIKIQTIFGGTPTNFTSNKALNDALKEAQANQQQAQITWNLIVFNYHHVHLFPQGGNQRIVVTKKYK